MPLPLSLATYDLSGNNKVVQYEFVVKNFATTQSQLDRIVKSPPFPKQSDLPKWRIYVFPRGVDTEKFKFQVVVGLWTERPDKKSAIFAVTIQFLNDNRSVIKTQVAYEHGLGPQWGVVDYRIAADSTMAIPVSDSGDLIVSVEIRPDILGQSGYDFNVSLMLFSVTTEVGTYGTIWRTFLRFPRQRSLTIFQVRCSLESFPTSQSF